MKFYLVRHGETDWNAEGRLQGQTDIPLSPTGREQIRRSASFFRSLSPKIDCIVSSPLTRAYESALIFAEALGYEPSAVLTEALLTERGYGNGEGLTVAEQDRLFPDHRFPGMESVQTLMERAHQAFEAVASRCSGQESVLIVSHGSLLRALATVMTAQLFPGKKWGIFGNGSIHLLQCVDEPLRFSVLYPGTQTEAYRNDKENRY